MTLDRVRYEPNLVQGSRK